MLGFFSLEVVCSASASIRISLNSTLNSADYNAICSSDGLTFPSKGRLRVVYIYIAVSKQSSDLAYLQMSIVTAEHFNVLFLSDKMENTEASFLRILKYFFKERTLLGFFLLSLICFNSPLVL